MAFRTLAVMTVFGLAVTGVSAGATAAPAPTVAERDSADTPIAPASHGLIGYGCGPHEDPTNVPIPDNGTIVRHITVVDCQATGGTGDVEIHIVHPYRGDLSVVLTPPSGSSYLLKNSNPSDSGDNWHATYTLSGITVVNGTWELRVSDVAFLDTGYLDSWKLRFW